jgi:hypothetical protein
MSTIHGPGAIAPPSRLAPPVPEFPDKTIGGEGFGRKRPGDEPYADPSALLAQAPAQKPAATGKPPLDPVGIIGHLGAPDAIVYTMGAANLAGQRHFVLANPLTGSATHFISHRNDKINFAGLPLNRVETVHYGLGQATRREDGYGWSRKVGDIMLFANMRVGDTNGLRSDHGASGNVGFFGPPAALSGLAERMAASGNPRLRAMGEAFERGLQVAGAAGSEFGLAWRGTLTVDRKSGEAVLNLSGQKIPLHDFIEAMKPVSSINRGSPAVARANNLEDHLGGENPYALADYTRNAQGELRNHGDPVSAIAGGVVELGRSLLPGTDPVRTNAQARSVLEMAIARDIVPLTPEQRRLWLGSAFDSNPLEDLHPLGAAQRQQLHATLRQLDRYGLDFGSPTIRAAARAAAADTAGAAAALDRQFVRDVFEGDFRTQAMKGGNHPLFDLAVGLNRWAGVFSAALDAGPVARDDVMIQQMRARAEGLEARLNAFNGGVLKALSIDAGGLDARDRPGLANRAVDLLASALERRLADRGVREPNSQALHDAFHALSAAERAAIGARINAALR